MHARSCFDPAGGVVVIMEGTARQTCARVEYRMDARARYFGPDQAVIASGLKYEGFKPGTEIWYPGDDAYVLRESVSTIGHRPYRGKVIRIDRDRGIVVVRIGTGPEAKEIQAIPRRQRRDTGVPTKRQSLLCYVTKDFEKRVADIWFRPVPNATTIRELRLYIRQFDGPVRPPVTAKRPINQASDPTPPLVAASYFSFSTQKNARYM